MTDDQIAALRAATEAAAERASRYAEQVLDAAGAIFGREGRRRSLEALGGVEAWATASLARRLRARMRRRLG